MSANESESPTLPPAANPVDPEVIVVGAGPTGLMTALLLARCGVRVRIFDKNAQGAHESRALVIQARSLELFLALGLARHALDRGTFVTGGQIVHEGKPAASFTFDDIGRTNTPFPLVLILPQRDTETILHDELRRLGVEVERPVEVTGFAQTAEGVAVQAKGADGAAFAARAAYLVGADGAHSIVRKTLGLKFEGSAYPSGFLLADCRFQPPLASDRLTFFLRGKHLAVYFPLPGGGALGRILVMDDSEPQDPHAGVEKQGGTDVPLAEVQAAFREVAGTTYTLSDPQWTTRYRVHHRGVDRYRVGRVFVAGDAAHIHSPAGGQGMNTGLQDAANLAWKLALSLRGQAARGLLDSYHGERWPVGHRVLTVTDRMFSTMTSQSEWVSSLRNALLPRLAGPLMHTEFVRGKAFHFVSQLGIRYEKGACVQDEGAARRGAAPWKHGPAPGQRAPNAAYARNQDVFGLLTDYRFHVLAWSRQGLGPEEIGALCDGLAALPQPSAPGLAAHVIAHTTAGRDERILRAESGEAFTAYGVSGGTPQALYLIRPDGYVAWRANRLDLPALADFLRERFC